MSNNRWDVAIVGAGPAGSTAAYHLAKRGLSVALFDKHPFPREKVCGDGLIPDTLACLFRMGLLEKVASEGRVVRDIRMFSPSRIEFRVTGRFITLKRTELDSLILNKAIEEGAYFKDAAVSSVEQVQGGVNIRLSSGVAEFARICVLATGSRTELANSLGMVRRAGHSAVAVRCYVHSMLPLNELVFSWDRSILPGYAWIFPLADQEFNIWYGVFEDKPAVALRDSFHKFMRNFPLAAELIGEGEFSSQVKGAFLRCGLSGADPVSGNILAIGETIGTTFPFTGEGIGKAMESAEIASEVIVDYFSSGLLSVLGNYPVELESRLRSKYKGYEAALKWLTRPWVGDFIASRAKKSAFLRGALAGIVNETTDPRAIFSVRGVVRSLTG